LTSLTFEQGKDEAAALVRYFAAHREAYRGANYKEAHAHQEFFDPFFATKDAGETQRLQRLIEAADQQTDALVYELYGPTAEEIAVVEGEALKR
jgi:hypothetical protein